MTGSSTTHTLALRNRKQLAAMTNMHNSMECEQIIRRDLHTHPTPRTFPFASPESMMSQHSPVSVELMQGLREKRAAAKAVPPRLLRGRGGGERRQREILSTGEGD